MPGLKKLDLFMEYIGRREEVEVENEWVKVMMGVRRIQEVTVEIVLRTSPWAGDRCEEVERVVKEAWSQNERDLARTRTSRHFGCFGLACHTIKASINTLYHPRVDRVSPPRTTSLEDSPPSERRPIGCAKSIGTSINLSRVGAG